MADDPDSRPPPRSLNRRALLTLGATFAAYAGLTATHRGEFWPLSIFPMFSLAGRPWRRALMLRVDDEPVPWTPTTLDALPGQPVSTTSVGLSGNDMSKFVQLTTSWDRQRIAALREFWQARLDEGDTLLLMRADGSLRADGSVQISLTPLVLLRPDGHEVNPHLQEASA